MNRLSAPSFHLQPTYPEAAITDPLLSPEQVAELLGVKVNTLAIWRCTSRYPTLAYIRVGGCIRYRLSAIEAFLQERTVSQS